MKTIAIATFAILAASAASANGFAPVPEIDAAAGVAAVAALGGAVAVLRERFKR